MTEQVTQQEFQIYVKAVNGSLERIERQLESLNEKIDRRLDQVDERIENQRKNSLESHRRIHGRIDNVDNRRIGKTAAIIISILSAVTVGCLTGIIAVVLK